MQVTERSSGAGDSLCALAAVAVRLVFGKEHVDAPGCCGLAPSCRATTATAASIAPRVWSAQPNRGTSSSSSTGGESTASDIDSSCTVAATPALVHANAGAPQRLALGPTGR